MNNPNEKKSVYVLAVVLYYIVTSIAALLLGKIQPATHIPEIIIQLTQFGPTIGVIIVILIFSKKLNLHLAKGVQLNSIVLKRLLTAVLLVVAIFTLSIVWFKINGHNIIYSNPGSLSQPFLMILIAQFIGAAGEEFGWRCFLQPFLQSRLGVLLSSILVGLLWGLWHVGIFSKGAAFAGFFLLMTIALSIIMGELLRYSKGNHLFISTAFHALINIGLLLFFKEEDGNVFAMGTVAVVCTVVSIGIYFFNNLTSHASKLKNTYSGELNEK
jgi:membrane protease YdiL (CAAX protease family)